MRTTINGTAKQYATDIGSLPKDATHVAALVQLPGQGRVVATSSTRFGKREVAT